jgi:DNA-binding NarL/FixJ family response regulator
MAPVIRVAVCGSTLHMAGLAACLEANPDVEVLRVPAEAAALLQSLDEPAPAVVAFDLGEMPGDLVLALLRDRPEVILVGVDPSSDRLLLLSGRQAQPVSAAELLQAITGDVMGASLPNSTSGNSHVEEATGSRGAR